MGDVGQGIGQHHFLPLERAGLFSQQCGDLVDLVFEDAEVAFAVIPDLQVVISPADLPGVAGNPPDLIVLLLQKTEGRRSESGAGEQSQQQKAGQLVSKQIFHQGGGRLKVVIFEAVFGQGVLPPG